MAQKKKPKSFFAMTAAERDADVAKYDAGVPFEATRKLSAADARRWAQARSPKKMARAKTTSLAVAAMVERIRRKVKKIFEAMPGANLDAIDPKNSEAYKRLTVALGKRFGKRTPDVAFHLTDWNADAAFLLAFALYPDRFDADEVEAGITQFLLHAPNHVAAAAKLAGDPIQDIFFVGPLTRDAE